MLLGLSVAPTKEDEKIYDYNGRKVTYAQFRYLTALDNQKVLERVNALATANARQVISTASALGQQEMGGFLRQTVPALIDKWGNVNGTQAVAYYQASRDAWFENRQRALRADARKGQNRRADRFALAKLQGQLYVATQPIANPVEIAESIIGYGMSNFVSSGFESMDSSVGNALTRAVASYHHNTMLYNSGLDSAVVKVQRIADRNACAFCRTLAFDKYGDVRTSDYAIKFHDNCHCTIETLYEGDTAVRPDYYDKFQEEYENASAEVGTRNAKDLFAQVRKESGAS